MTLIFFFAWCSFNKHRGGAMLSFQGCLRPQEGVLVSGTYPPNLQCYDKEPSDTSILAPTVEPPRNTGPDSHHASTRMALQHPTCPTHNYRRYKTGITGHGSLTACAFHPTGRPFFLGSRSLPHPPSPTHFRVDTKRVFRQIQSFLHSSLGPRHCSTTPTRHCSTTPTRRL